MGNIFLFIRRYFNFLFFLSLQVFSIYLIVQYNKYHYAVGGAYMNEVTGKVNVQYNKIDNFLQLNKSNEILRKENERLLNQLKYNFESADTSNRIVTDSIPYDTMGNKRKWLYQSAKVVSNSVTAQNNFIVISRGTKQQMRKDEGVIDPNNSVVGIVTDVSENFSVVMSMLHRDSRISVKLKKGGDAGQVLWDGKEPNRLSLIDIRKSARVVKGDTVLSSGMTPTFPYGLLVGTIDEVIPDKSTNNYIIKIKSAANFYNLQYVYAIDNLHRDEINKLLEKAKSKINN